ncbi:MAG: Nramp family divalent metal transporter [Candidatus Kapabacteria bacterium]|nr:Nramp family divalent metal transporter [Ignavibacteriota bacterium]MCW5884514.1 Nramp family divalent metal transporter [Candidatus Kapabacteria bacterium]
MRDLKGIVKTIGPGILFAGAAIGGSHLIQSTRAGADYGYSLIIVILLVNLFKYPFFEFSYRYTSAKNKTLLQGYQELGSWAIWSFLIISIITGIINLAALALGASGLLGYIIGSAVQPLYLSIGLVTLCILILLIGKYPLLDGAMKFMVFMLGIFTTIAFFMSLSVNNSPIEGFNSPEIFERSSILFIIALMGWMPTPIEASVWTSLWSVGRQKQKKYIPTLKESLIDFHIGYIITTVLAVFFLVLGARAMFGTGIGFSSNGTEFSKQLIDIYATLLGNWSKVILAPVAFITIFSSLLTVVDAYPRSITSAIFLSLREKTHETVRLHEILTLSMSAVALIIVSFLIHNLKMMIDLATVISFLAAPVFAVINYKTVTAKDFPDSYRPKLWLKLLAIAGIIFLSGFSFIYLWSLFVL